MANMIRWETNPETKASTAEHRGWSITVHETWDGWNWVMFRERPDGEKMWIGDVEQTRGAAKIAAVRAVNEQEDAA